MVHWTYTLEGDQGFVDAARPAPLGEGQRSHDVDQQPVCVPCLLPGLTRREVLGPAVNGRHVADAALLMLMLLYQVLQSLLIAGDSVGHIDIVVTPAELGISNPGNLNCTVEAVLCYYCMT